MKMAIHSADNRSSLKSNFYATLIKIHQLDRGVNSATRENRTLSVRFADIRDIILIY